MAFLQRFFGTSKDTSSSSSPLPPTDPIPTSIPPINTTATTPNTDHDETSTSTSFLNPRSRKQLGLFWAGAGFFMLSSLITRRAMIRRFKAHAPKFYQPSNRPNQVNGAMEALDALNLATINVLSVAIMVAGGISWVFDVTSVEDMRRRTRDALGTAGQPVDGEADAELEEWVAGVLKRRDYRELAKRAREVEVEAREQVEREKERLRKEEEEKR